MGFLNKIKKKIIEEKVSEPKDKPQTKQSRPQKEVKKDTEKSQKTITKTKKKSSHLGITGKKIKGVAYRILEKPLVTEKVTDLGAYNKYAFYVSKRANKTEIKKAIKEVYGVTPVSVNIINLKSKKVRFGKSSGQTKSQKKAIVTLKKGDKIEVYEGV